jgi:hypothetical protein
MKNGITIIRENGGYSINAYINGNCVKTAWKNSREQAHYAATIMADYYTDENGQRLSIEDNIEA